LASYDAHLFIKQFGEDSSDIKLILNTEEKYSSFSKMLKYDSGKVNNKGEPIINKTELRFIDSFKFVSSSLEKLSTNLEEDQFKELSKYFPKEHLNMITKKLAYPYEYVVHSSSKVSKFIFKKITHPRKLKMQSFLNVITL
jgi:hypothetical protein